MTIDILPHLDSMQALYARDAHARKMAIAALVLTPRAENGAEIAEATMSKELVAAAEAGLLPAGACAAIFHHGRATGKMAEATIKKFSAKEKPLDRAEPGSATVLHMALAHPGLPEKVFAKLFAERSGLPPNAQSALLANPLAQQYPDAEAAMGKNPRISYILGRCAFADLRDKREVELLGAAFEKLTGCLREDALVCFLSNPTFDEPIAKRIHETVLVDGNSQLSPQLVRKFLMTPGDRVAVKAGATPMAPLSSYGEMAISPEAKPAKVLSAFKKQRFTPSNTSHLILTASFIMSPACPEEVFDTLVHRENLFLGSNRYSGSKFDAKIMECIENGKISFEPEPEFAAACPDAKDPILWASRQKAIAEDPLGSNAAANLRICIHKNFDWKAHPIEEMPPVCKIVESATQRAKADKYGTAPKDMFEGIAALFSERTSAVRLDKIATMFPELRELAACHPNGGEIMRGGTPEKFREAVLPVASLAGAGKSGIDTAQGRGLAI